MNSAAYTNGSPPSCYFLNAWQRGEIPVAQIPRNINVFPGRKISFSVVSLADGPMQQVKILAALAMLSYAKKLGFLEKVHTIVANSSGNFAEAVGRLAGSFGIGNVSAVVPPDLPPGKLFSLRQFGVQILHPIFGKSGIASAEEFGKQQGWYNLNQYSVFPDGNDYGAELYRTWLAPFALSRLQKLPTVCVLGIGTGLTVSGVSQHMRERGNIKMIGVQWAHGHAGFGVRSLADMTEIRRPWREAVDDTVKVERQHALQTAIWLARTTSFSIGPSGGLAMAGAMLFIERCIKTKFIEDLRGPDGEVRVLVFLPDGGRPYAETFNEFMEKHPLLYASGIPALDFLDPELAGVNRMIK